MASIVGTPGDDSITPSAASAGVDGGKATAGHDSIRGGGGSDTIDGGAGNDSLDGGDGDDDLSGGSGNDLLAGGAGSDVLRGGSGADTLSGGTGADLFELLADGQPSASTTAATDLLADFALAEGDRLLLNRQDGTLTRPDGSWTALVWSGSTGRAVSALAAGAALPLQDLAGLAAVQVFWQPATDGGGWVLADLDRDGVLTVADLATRFAAGSLPSADASWFAAGSFANALPALATAGGSGNDTLAGTARFDIFTGSAGNDRYDGGPGANNLLDYSALGVAIVAGFTGWASGTVAKAGQGSDSFAKVQGILGTGLADRLDASTVAAGVTPLVLEGGGGNDTILGAGTAAVLASYDSSPGAVLVDLAAGTAQDGWGGTDTLVNIRRVSFASGNGDTLRGSSGDDSLLSTAWGNKLFDGRGGFDLYRYGGSENVVLQLGTALVNGAWQGSVVKAHGTDTLLGVEAAAGGAGDDTLLGSPSDDWLAGYRGNDRLDGGAGSDTVAYDYVLGGIANLPQQGAVVDLVHGIATDPWGGHDVLLAIENARGSGLGDVLAGLAAAASRLQGLAGNDTLLGGSGNDTLDGGSGDDSLDGGDGANLLQGGDGNDTLAAGSDNDTLDGGSSDDSLDGGDGANLLQGGDGNDMLAAGSGNDTLDGSSGDDSLDGGAGTNLLQGGDGNDMITAGNGSDTLVGGAGDDSLAGGAGANLLQGGDGNDTLAAGSDNDTLDGGNGADSLAGGDGADLLTGGAGDDVLRGGTGGDTLSGGSGNNLLDGGAGTDVARFDAARRDGSLAWSNAAGSFATAAGADGLQSIETLRFLDGRLDADPTSAAAEAWRLYAGILGHAPEAASFADVAQALEAGSLATAQLAEALAARSLSLRPDLGVAGFVGLVHQQALGRPPTDAEAAIALSGLQQGMTPGAWALSLVDGAEAVQHANAGLAQGLWLQDPAALQVASLYDAVLGRRPDAGGLQTYVQALQQGSSATQLAQMLLGSAEFTGANGALADNAGFVARLHDLALHRAPTAAELAGATAGLAQGGSRAAFAVGLASGSEHLVRLHPLVAGGVLTTASADAISGFARVQGNASADRILGTAGADQLDGGGGNDTLQGGAGDDSLAGGSGADLFIIAAGDGSDRILDFQPGTDRLQLLGFGLAGFAQVQPLLHGTGQGLLLDLPGSSLLLAQLAPGQLAAGDLLFG